MLMENGYGKDDGNVTEIPKLELASISLLRSFQPLRNQPLSSPTYLLSEISPSSVFATESTRKIIVFSTEVSPSKQYLRALIRGILGTLAGALANSLGAIALGAPVGIQYLPKTLHWSLLISSLTVTWHH